MKAAPGQFEMQILGLHERDRNLASTQVREGFDFLNTMIAL